MGLFLEKINKLETVDKIIIAFVFVVGAIFFPIFCFATEGEEVDVQLLDGLSFNSSTIIESTSRIAVVELEEGYLYTVTSSSSNTRQLAFSNSLEVGSEIYNRVSINAGSSYTFSTNDFKYAFLIGSSGSNLIYEVVRSPFGMNSTIENLSNVVSFDTIWDTFAFSIPYIAVVVLCCIGIMFIKRLISKLSKGKSGVI